RYHTLYPPKHAPVSELFQLVRHAAASFPRVALYFENSLLPPDLKLLPSAAAAVARIETLGPKLVVQSPSPVGIAWKGPAKVDDLPWPIRDAQTLWRPAGSHTIQAAQAPAPRLVYLNADLKSARVVSADSIEFTYQSQSRAIALADRPIRKVQIDGEDAPPTL